MLLNYTITVDNKCIICTSQRTFASNSRNKIFIQLPDTSFNIANAYMGIFSKQYNTGISITQWPEKFDIFQANFKNTLTKATILTDTLYSTNKHRSRLLKLTMKDESWFSSLKDSLKILWLHIVEYDTTTILLSSAYAGEKDKLLENLIKPAITSFTIVDSIREDPLAQLPFSLDTNDSPFKYAGIFMQKGAIFNVSGKTPFTLTDTLHISIYPLSIFIRDNNKEAFITTEKNSLMLNGELVKQNTLKLANKDAYEIISKNQSGGLQYNAYIFDEDATYFIKGQSKKEHMQDIVTIQKTIRTLKIR